MEKCNTEIKKLLKEYKMTQWRLAELLGVSEFTLCRWLRHELPEEKKQEYIELIKAEAEKTNN